MCVKQSEVLSHEMEEITAGGEKNESALISILKFGGSPVGNKKKITHLRLFEIKF